MLAMYLLSVAVGYVLVTAALFGDPLQPLALALLSYDRLGLPNWGSLAILSGTIPTLIFAIPLRESTARALRPAVFVILAIAIPTVAIGLYADSERRRGIIAFGADEVEESSFLRSVREVPKDFQFFLHAAALKDCIPYAWSYRTLSFYRLPENVAINVLPERWLKKCGIVRIRTLRR